MKKIHDIQGITFTGEEMILKVDDGEYRFSLADVSKPLAKATPTEKETYELSPSGYGIHWPLLDEDLSIDGLLGLKHKLSKSKESVAS